jgi:hypothetical protein
MRTEEQTVGDGHSVRSTLREALHPERRRGPRPWRTLGGIAVVTVASLVGASLPAGATEPGRPTATGSSAPTRAVTSVEGWSVRLRTADGQRVPMVAPDGERALPRLVVGSSYRLSATVPRAVRAQTRTRSFVLQHREAPDDAWKTVRLLTMGRNGRLRDTFTVSPEMIKLRDYRLVAATGPDAGYRLASVSVGRSSAAPAQILDPSPPTTTTVPPTTTSTTVPPPTTSTTGVTAPTTVPTSPSTTVPAKPLPAPPASATFSAVADVQFAIEITNTTGNDLILYVPSSRVNGAYQEAEFSLADGETKSLVYNNPPAGAAFHLRVNKQKCLGTCTDYIVVWSEPSNSKNWPSPCSAGSTMPKFFSGQIYQVDLTNKTDWNSSFAVGTLTGPLAGPGSGPTTCTFWLQDKADVAVDTWIQNHPKVVGFVELAVVIAVVVAVAVVTMGAAAPEEAAVLAEVAEEAGPVVEQLAADDTISVTAIDGSFVNGSYISSSGFLGGMIEPSVAVQEGGAVLAESSNAQVLFRY